MRENINLGEKWIVLLPRQKKVIGSHIGDFHFLTLLRDQCDFFSPPKGKIKCTIYFKQKFKKMSDVANMIQIKTNICKLILICKKKKTVVRRFNKHSIFKNILFSSNYLIVQALEVKLAVDVRWRMCLKCLK